ncbi:formate dehydrogenase subunit delta [Aurantimonas sp. Leaf443]|uniref:formate dehydrogenase subunit delta n=1 Tax=Aurantimonas sp. Leaf443 TaxID=1736378 RepID=UPI0006FE8F7A|nr:formate dehydrogenase subunit delta [Aurantimonas sp. Leaf443]KQT86338.1 formate dehydrogenase [Aurantimonas sp. Leaf443]
MANQIATFFRSSPEAGRTDGIAEHINAFWEPRMRRQLFERVDGGATEGIDPLVLEAMPKIRRPAAEGQVAAAG